MSIEAVDLDVYNYSGSGSFSIDSDGLHATNQIFLKSKHYIPINPSIYTFKYDIVVSFTAGNMFYVGFERYDKDKTARSNNATVYFIANNPSNDVVRRRYRGTIDLSTDGVNPTAFILLRVLNLWTNSTAETGTATIHSLSLLGVQANESISKKINQNGRFISDRYREFERTWSTNGVDAQVGKVSIARNGYTDSTILYEF